jgi:hypothetical protein
MMLARLLLRVRAADARDCAARLAVWRSGPCDPHHAAGHATAAISPDAPAAGGAVPAAPGPIQPPQHQQHTDVAELAAALAAQGLSHSAVMSVVGWQPNTARGQQANILARVAGLQKLFGRDYTNRMLVA